MISGVSTVADAVSAVIGCVSTVTDAVNAVIGGVSAVTDACEVLEIYRTTRSVGNECRMIRKQKRLTPKAGQRNSSKICNDTDVAHFEQLFLEGDAVSRTTALHETAGVPTEIRTEHLQNR